MARDQAKRVGAVQPARDESHHYNALHLRLARFVATVLLRLLQPAEQRMVIVDALALTPIVIELRLQEVVEKVEEDYPVFPQ